MRERAPQDNDNTGRLLATQGLELRYVVAAEEQGLNVNRLLYVRYLRLTGHISDGEPVERLLAQLGAA